MKLPYRQYYLDPSPLNPSGVLYEPRVEINALGPGGMGTYWALLDTGAYNCIMPLTEAEALGIDLTGADKEEVAGFTGHTMLLSVATLEFQINYGGQTYQWPSLVGFAPYLRPEDETVILGHTGCLDYFQANFDGHEHEVELLPSPNFPGTISNSSTP